MEMPAPRFDRTEVVEVAKGEDHSAVAGGGEADERASAPVRNRAQVRVDESRELDRDCRLPVAAGAPVEVFGIAVLLRRSLRSDEDHAAPQPVARAAGAA